MERAFESFSFVSQDVALPDFGFRQPYRDVLLLACAQVYAEQSRLWDPDYDEMLVHDLIVSCLACIADGYPVGVQDLYRTLGGYVAGCIEETKTGARLPRPPGGVSLDAVCRHLTDILQSGRSVSRNEEQGI